MVKLRRPSCILKSKFCFTGIQSFRLHACKEDGTLEAQTVELKWDTISRYESDEESMAFCFQYTRSDKPPRWVKVFTPYVSLIGVTEGFPC